MSQLDFEEAKHQRESLASSKTAASANKTSDSLKRQEEHQCDYLQQYMAIFKKWDAIVQELLTDLAKAEWGANALSVSYALRKKDYESIYWRIAHSYHVEHVPEMPSMLSHYEGEAYWVQLELHFEQKFRHERTLIERRFVVYYGDASTLSTKVSRQALEMALLQACRTGGPTGIRPLGRSYNHPFSDYEFDEGTPHEELRNLRWMSAATNAA